MIYTANLRSAKATDTYVCRGASGGEVFVAPFTYHGFQYVQVSGVQGLSVNLMQAMMGLHFHTANKASGQLSFDSALGDSVLSRVYEAVVWGQRSNMMCKRRTANQFLRTVIGFALIHFFFLFSLRAFCGWFHSGSDRLRSARRAFGVDGRCVTFK